MTVYKLPVTNLPNQSFSSTLQVNGQNVNLEFFFSWNLCSETWEMTVHKGDEEILNHVPLIVGENIIGYKEYLGLGSLSLVSENSTKLDKPNMDNLGTEYLLFWTTPDETVA